MSSAVVIGMMLAACLLFVYAASRYPGGNYFENGAHAHDFWRNALCDVARTTAIGGADNTIGARFARAAMAIMAVAIGGFFALERSRWVRILGVLSVPGALAVVCLPSDRFSSLHGVSISVAGPVGIGAALLLVIDLARVRFRAALLGVFTLAAATLDFGLYAKELVLHGNPQLAVTVLERITSLLLVVWILQRRGEDLGPRRRRISCRSHAHS